MSEFKVNTITNRDGSHGPQICGITTFGSSGMQLPSGPTEFRGGRGRAIVFVGATPSATTLIDAFNTATSGNAFDFGDHRFGSSISAGMGHAADGVRGLLAGGYVAPVNLGTIDFINIATTGSSSLFGEFDDGSTGGYFPMASPTRAVFGRARQGLNYINFTTGGKTISFGSMTGDPRTGHIASCSNSTRGIMAGGESPSPSKVNTITYITLATLGDGVDFGDLSANSCFQDGTSSGHGGL